MKTNTPISDFLKITRNEEGRLSLPAIDQTKNHIGTAHAGAQFVLAEMASGSCLQELLPQYADKVVPVIRRAEVKYSKTGESELNAFAELDGNPEELAERLGKSGRALATVKVSLKDGKGDLTFKGTFVWYLEVLK